MTPSPLVTELTRTIHDARNNIPLPLIKTEVLRDLQTVATELARTINEHLRQRAIDRATDF